VDERTTADLEDATVENGTIALLIDAETDR
jgi:hypothetical protein